MDKVVTIDNYRYSIIKNYKDGFSEEEFKTRLTDYFYDYDYILGDWAYGKLRLKGFYDPKNSKVKEINNYKNIKKYIKDYCAYECKYFIAKKVYK
ncbi:MAG TPA: YutD family protein [Mollicutes bacterium]|jgi:uncharacterized protein YutD|nr:YutD family protein [Mollicutes bacterium]